MRPRSIVDALTLAVVVCTMAAGCVMDYPELESEVASELALPPPTGLTANAVSPTRIDLQWDPSPGAVRYAVYRGTSPGNLSALTSTLNTSYISNYLTPGQLYCWAVRNVNNLGQPSGYSNEVCVTTPTTSSTPAPTGVTAVALSSSQIEVTWDAVPGATVYYVHQAIGTGPFNYVGSVSPPTTRYIAGNLQPGTTYSFQIYAVTAAGTSPASATASATTLADGLEGYWKFDEATGPTSADASGFGRDGALSSAAFSTDRPPVFRTKNRSSLSISTAASSRFDVPFASALRMAGSFAVAGWIKLPSTAVDTPIIGMRASGCGTISWLLSYSAATGFQFTDATTVRTFGVTAIANEWMHIAISTSSAGPLRLYINGIQQASVSYAAATRALNMPLTIGHVGSCAGGAVLLDEVRVFSRALSAAEVSTLGTRPPAPTNVTAIAESSKRIRVSWNPVPNAALYYLYRGTAPGNETFYTSVAGTEFVAANLAVETQYSWYVLADVNDLYSEPSNEALATTLSAPAAVADLTATYVPTNRANLTWSAVPRAVRYFVYQSVNGGAYTYRTTVLSAGTFQVANLSPASSYAFYVVALDDSNTQSQPSNIATVSTP